MRIGELAERTGVSTKTIRFWEAEGLLPDPPRTAAGYRDYDASIAGHIAFIRGAQAAAFTLAEIRSILRVRDAGEAPCEHVGALVAERLADVDARLRQLRETRQRLRHLARRAAQMDPAECTGLCGILE